MMEDGLPDSRDIQERALDYGVQAVRLFQALQAQPDRAGWTIGRQYLRAATSIGANLAEAQSAESKQDFIHKCSIAQKEARESLFWLRLLERTEILPPADLRAPKAETNGIIAILAAIIKNTRRNAGYETGQAPDAAHS